MSTLTVLCGMPCAGKSTHAQRYEPTSVVSLDACIAMVGDGAIACRPQAGMLFWQIVQFRLSLDRDVVVDRTCLTPSTRRRLVELAQCYNAQTALIFFTVPLAEAQRRNSRRETPLPERTLADCHLKAESASRAILAEGWGTVTFRLAPGIATLTV